MTSQVLSNKKLQYSMNAILLYIYHKYSLAFVLGLSYGI